MLKGVRQGVALLLDSTMLSILNYSLAWYCCAEFIQQAPIVERFKLNSACLSWHRLGHMLKPASACVSCLQPVCTIYITEVYQKTSCSRHCSSCFLMNPCNAASLHSLCRFRDLQYHQKSATQTGNWLNCPLIGHCHMWISSLIIIKCIYGLVRSIVICLPPNEACTPTWEVSAVPLLCHSTSAEKLRVHSICSDAMSNFSQTCTKATSKSPSH